ncbi:MAG: VCBS repeat-containing protein [Kiritimatiellae bacterium]|nr:VCBS repeat-containing protein [Kiritimatiellia bacterium]
MKTTAVIIGVLALHLTALGSPFAEAPIYQAKLTCRPMAVAFGDLNGDGKNDMLITVYGETSYKEGKLLIYFNSDTGFPEKPDRSIDLPGCFRTALGDFDGDGKTDIAVTEGRSVCLLLNKNGFDPAKSEKYTNGDQSNGFIEVCKINDRGVFDILTGPVWRKFFTTKNEAEFSVENGYLRGPKENDTWTTCAIDLDSDGAMDIVGSGRADNTLRVYYGPLLTRYVNPKELSEFLELKVPGPMSEFAVSDLNGDNLYDLVAADAKNRKTYVYFQDQPVGFDPDAKPSLTLNGGGGAYVEDVNGDQLADLIVVDRNQDAVEIFLQKKGAPLPEDVNKADQVIKARGVDFLAFADVNNDGAKDMALKTASGTIQIYPGVKQTKSEKR